MRFYSRAGLIVLTLAIFLTALTTAAPVSTSSRPDEKSIDKRSQAGVVLNEHVLGGLNYSPRTLLPNNVYDVSLVRRKSIFTKIKEGFKKLGKGIKKVAKKIGSGIKKVAQKVGHGIKTAAKKVGSGIKKAAQKVGKGIKTAAKKVGKFVKTTGAKIAKFGLKIVSTVASVASKVVKFIPGIGTALSKGLTAGSMGINAASNAIHVKLPGKLEKGMKVMDKIRNPVGGAAGKVLNIFRRDDHIASREFMDRSEYELTARDLEWENISEREWSSELDVRDSEYYELEERD